VRFLIVFYLLAVSGLALLAQMILPVIFPILNALGFGSALVPLVVIYASLELGDERAPVLAAISGFFLDLIPSSLHLGTSTLVLFSLSALIVTQASKPESHSWPFRLAFVLVGTFTFCLMSYVLELAETARWTWPLAVWSKITFASILNLLLCPLFFYLIGLVPRACGWRPDYETQERHYAR
jgi:cell shape-determining protein MreD